MKNKKGQITLFIIIGIIIVVTALLIFMFKPKITSTTKFDAQNPSAYIDACVEEKIDSTLSQIYLNGGVLKRDHTYNYKNEEVTYLCYTNEYYKPCFVEHPLLEKIIINDLTNELQGTVDQCFDNLKESYENKAYSTELKKGTVLIKIDLDKIYFNFSDYEITVIKQDSENYKDFDYSLNSNLFNILQITNNIIIEEISEGDSEITKYMDAFKDLKVEKKVQIDETTIYIITNKNTESKFQFAVRSQALSTNPNLP
jgi:hypothetical protein